MAAGKRTTYVWSPTISSSGLTKKQINRKIKEMEKRGYVVPQNIREQIAFSNSDTLKSIERKIAEKSKFEYYTYEMQGGRRKKGEKKNKIAGTKAYELEQKARAYNAHVQRLQNLKQYKGENLAWTKIDIRKRNLESEEVLEKLEKRLAKRPSEIVAFERGKTTLPWDNFVKSLNSASGLSKEERDLILKAMEELGYKAAALSWHKKDSGNKFEELMSQEIARGGGKKGGDIWVLYASGGPDMDNATSDLIKTLILDNGMSAKEFLDRFGPASKKEKVALAKKIAGREKIPYTESDFLGEEAVKVEEDETAKKARKADEKSKIARAEKQAKEIAKWVKSFEKTKTQKDMEELKQAMLRGADVIKEFKGKTEDVLSAFAGSSTNEQSLANKLTQIANQEIGDLNQLINSFSKIYEEED
jgi:hypothetical protein